MRLRLAAGLLVAIVCATSAVRAQIPGRNVNMVSGASWPDGDPMLQRQNEPSVAASTRNPLHLLGGANDYRTVDLPGLPDGEETGDAWLGLFKSKDGGQRWTSTLLPGYPQDTSDAGRASPIYGYQAGADPVVRAGSNGLFYFSGLAFDREVNGRSAIFVARFIDNNNQEAGDPIKYLGTSVIATDSGETGGLLDKPWMAVDVPRTRARTCVITTNGEDGPVEQRLPAGAVYVAYSMVTEDAIGPMSQIYLASSADCGATWSTPTRISRLQDRVNQGATIAIDPRNGAVHVSWRKFDLTGDADAMMIRSAPGRGRPFDVPRVIRKFHKFRNADRDIWRVFEHKYERRRGIDRGRESEPEPPRAGGWLRHLVPWLIGRRASRRVSEVDRIGALDQGTSEFDLAFRTNAYPTLVVDSTGRLYMAWTERGFATHPDAGSVTEGDARIVLTTSADGVNWSQPGPVAEYGQRGHQLMPALAFAGGKLMLVYYDLVEDRSQTFTRFVDDRTPILERGRRHTIDIRASMGTPGADPVFESPVRVSDYLLGARSATGPLEQLQVNPPNLPMFRLGTVPFLGDYIDLAPAPSMVPNVTGGWRFNTDAAATPPIFHAVWTDNRDVIPPSVDTNGDLNPWNDYTPPTFLGPSPLDPTRSVPMCQPGNAGSRNQNIYTARITGGLLVGSPGNTKPLSTTLQRAFVVFVQNTTLQRRSFRLTILNQPPDGRASFDQFPLPPLTPASPPPLAVIDLTINPRSTASRTVYMTSSDAHAPVGVDVSEIDVPGAPTEIPGGLEGLILLNPDVLNPEVENPEVENPEVENPEVENAEVYNPEVENPEVENPEVENPEVENPEVENPEVENPEVENIRIANPDIDNPEVENFVILNPEVENPEVENPEVENPEVENGTITDITWQITNTGNTTAAFNVNVFLQGQQDTLPDGILTQLIIHKTYKTPVVDQCDLKTITQNVLVANIPSPDIVTAGGLGFHEPNDPSEKNATLWLEPGAVASITLRVFDPDASNNVIFDGASIDPGVVPREDVDLVLQQHSVDTEAAQAGVTEPPLVTAPVVDSTVAIDTTALPAVSTFAVESAGAPVVPVTPAGGVTNHNLLPATYRLHAPAASTTAAVDFVVTPAGTVDFAPALDGILSGRGTPTLVVRGHTITVDTRALRAGAAEGEVQDLFVASYSNNQVLRYDGQTGAPLGIFAQDASLSGPGAVVTGPDGNLYVSGLNSNNIVRFNGTTGAFIDEFVAAGTGGLSAISGIVFGPDGHLYVGSRPAGPQSILKFDGQTGALLASFTEGALDNPVGLRFGPDGLLYVANGFAHNVVRFNANTGAFLGVFASGSGLNLPGALAFGPDGDLYVSSYAVGGTGVLGILRFNGATGAFISTFVPGGSGGLANPVGVEFGHDGHLYVSDFDVNAVLRYDGTTGAFLGQFVTAGSGGLDGPILFAFHSATPLPASGGYVLQSSNVLASPVTTSGSVANFNVLPGTYTFRMPYASPTAQFEFTITAAGTVDFAAALDAFVSGRGTSTLVVGGAQVRVDTTAFDPLSSYMIVSGGVASGVVPAGSVRTIGMVPGSYTFHLPYSSSTASFVFTVTAGGLIDFDSSLDGFVSGRGTSTLVVSGASIAIDTTTFAAAATTYQILSSGPAVSQRPSGAVDTVHLLAGTYTFHMPYSSGTATFAFTVTGAGLIDFDASLDGFVSGRGTSTLVVSGAAVAIDTTAFAAAATTYQVLNGAVAISARPAGGVDNLRLLPGPFEFHLPYASATFFTFTVSAGGLIDFDPSLDGSVSGRGTATLTVRPLTIQIDTLQVRPRPRQADPGQLLVGSYGTNQVLRYNAVTGSFVSVFAAHASLVGPGGLVFGPDGHLYVAGLDSNNVVKFDGQTGAFLTEFVAPLSGGLNFPSAIAFGPDGHLYVTSALTDEVLRFNGQTGAFMSAFVTAGSGGLDDPFDLKFGPDGRLYVSGLRSNAVHRYNGTTGAAMDTFASAELRGPAGFAIGADGHLYVSSGTVGGAGVPGILRFDLNTTTFVDVFVPNGTGGLGVIQGLEVGPDGHLYAASGDAILKYDATNGAFVESFVAAGSGGLNLAAFFNFHGAATLPAPASYVLEPRAFGIPGLMQAGSLIEVTVLPGAHTLRLPHLSSTAAVSFIVSHSGTVDFDPALDSYVNGRGTNRLRVLGLPIAIDTAALDPRTDYEVFADGAAAAGAPATGGVVDWRLLPGNYRFGTPRASPSTGFDFSVTPAGTLDFAAALDAYVSGRGTATLTVQGHAINLDTTAIGANTTGYVVRSTSGTFAVGLTATGAVDTVRLLPGSYSFELPYASPSSAFGFTVTAAGTLDFAAALDAYVGGRGTATLTVQGYAINLDTTAIGANTTGYAVRSTSGTFAAGLTASGGVVSVRLLPGTYLIEQPYGSPSSAFAFTVTPGGTIDYAATLDAYVGGRGTATLIVSGHAIGIDTSAIPGDAYTIRSVSGTFAAGSTPTGGTLQVRLLPGNYVFTAAFTFPFTVLSDGTIDFDPGLEPDVTGRGSATLVVHNSPD